MILHSHDAQRAPRALRFWRPLPSEVLDAICGEGSVVELPVHTHDVLQLAVPTSPLAIIDARDDVVVAGPGQVHIAAPQEPHGVRSLNGAPCAMRVLLIAPEVLAGRGGSIPNLPRAAHGARRQVVVDDALLHAELWELIGSLRGPLISLDCAPRLIACVRRLLDRATANGSASPPRSAARQIAGIDRVRQHLREHVADNVSLDELASVAGLSKYYLLRAFRRAHGFTPHAYQMQLRLANAWRFIADGVPLSRATYDAGFADQSHLTRRFAATFGITPARCVRQLAVPPGTASKNAPDARWLTSPFSAA